MGLHGKFDTGTIICDIKREKQKGLTRRDISHRWEKQKTKWHHQDITRTWGLEEEEFGIPHGCPHVALAPRCVVVMQERG